MDYTGLCVPSRLIAAWTDATLCPLSMPAIESDSPMFHVVLFEPEIPPNTGNIIRLCANTGAGLHLIHPLGFTLEDKQLRRAGLDYDEFATVLEYRSLDEFIDKVRPPRLFAASTKGTTCYSTVRYLNGDAFLFGPESRGLPRAVLDSFLPERVLRIPMQKTSRSLNLSNAVSVMVYEALRQNEFPFAPAQEQNPVVKLRGMDDL